MKYVEEPGKARPWYKKPLVLATIAGALLLILGSAYFLTKTKKTTPFNRIPEIELDTDDYEYGTEAATVLLHMYNLSLPEGKFRKSIAPIIQGLQTNPTMSKFKALMRDPKNHGSRTLINKFKGTALYDLEAVFTGAGCKFYNGSYGSCSEGSEFHAAIRSYSDATVVPEDLPNRRPVAVIAQKKGVSRVLLRTVNDEVWFEKGAQEPLVPSDLKDMYALAIFYQYI